MVTARSQKMTEVGPNRSVRADCELLAVNGVTVVRLKKNEKQSDNRMI